MNLKLLFGKISMKTLLYLKIFFYIIMILISIIEL